MWTEITVINDLNYKNLNLTKFLSTNKIKW